MNNFDKLNLDKMIKSNKVEDCTQEIRDKRHSNYIKQDVDLLVKLKKKHFKLIKSNPSEFDNICINNCNFLFNTYTDIFNKIKKDEIDLIILYQFIEVLKEIEDGSIDQHNGSFKIGKLLKEMYIDSAIKKSDKLNKDVKDKITISHKEINYKDFKKLSN